MRKDIVKKHIPIITIIIIYVSILTVFDIRCPIRYFLGFPCATCGTTRALISFFTGDFSSAFYYHPLFFLSIPFIILLPHLNLNTFLGMKKKTREIILIIILISYITVYFIRLIFFKIP